MWFWPQAAFVATKHQLTVFVHQPLLQCRLVSVACRNCLSKLYQRGRNCLIPVVPPRRRDQLIHPLAQCRVRPGCSVLFSVTLHPPRMGIPLCLWAPALVLNHSPFEQCFLPWQSFSVKIFLVIVASDLSLSPPLRVHLHLPSPLRIRYLKTAVGAPLTRSPLLPRLNKPSILFVHQDAERKTRIVDRHESCLFYWNRCMPS